MFITAGCNSAKSESRFLPLYDNQPDFISLKAELNNLAPKSGQNNIKNSGFYRVTSKLLSNLLDGKILGQTQ